MPGHTHYIPLYTIYIYTHIKKIYIISLLNILNPIIKFLINSPWIFFTTHLARLGRWARWESCSLSARRCHWDDLMVPLGHLHIWKNCNCVMLGNTSIFLSIFPIFRSRFLLNQDVRCLNPQALLVYPIILHFWFINKPPILVQTPWHFWWLNIPVAGHFPVIPSRQEREEAVRLEKERRNGGEASPVGPGAPSLAIFWIKRGQLKMVLYI
jgi:hypothetical protein